MWVGIDPLAGIWRSNQLVGLNHSRPLENAGCSLLQLSHLQYIIRITKSSEGKIFSQKVKDATLR